MCNFCPFLINDRKDGSAKCSKYVNSKTTIKENNFIAKVYAYVYVKACYPQILIKLDIPFWCGLSNHIVEVVGNGPIHYIKEGKLHIDSGQNYTDTTHIISESLVDFSTEDGESLISKPLSKPNINYGTQPYKEPEKSPVCSSCGEEKEDVNRDEHLGMCDTCWDKCKFSHPKRYHARINNFRLKRKKDWQENFKVI